MTDHDQPLPRAAVLCSGAIESDGGPAEAMRRLVERCRAGDPGSMNQLVERFQGSVFGLCYRMVGHVHDAEDMVQETFARALKSLSRWDGAREFRPWLLAIAGNRCRTLLARRKRGPNFVGPLEELAEPKRNVEAAHQLAEELDLALSMLRTDHRRAFLLFHKQELSYAEISQVLNCPVGTVKTWVHRARRELIDRLRRRGTIFSGQVEEVRDVVR